MALISPKSDLIDPLARGDGNEHRAVRDQAARLLFIHYGRGAISRFAQCVCFLRPRQPPLHLPIPHVRSGLRIGAFSGRVDEPAGFGLGGVCRRRPAPLWPAPAERRRR